MAVSPSRKLRSPKRKKDLELGVAAVDALYDGHIADALALANMETNKRDYAQNIVNTLYRDWIPRRTSSRSLSPSPRRLKETCGQEVNSLFKR